ncbi:hypothetical protein FKP32DRAFT_1674310 [Trametes sanguinea]|nr:hypothetical protein FKP32DRAFT_1674310 [Trametes sanguinea]
MFPFNFATLLVACALAVSASAGPIPPPSPIVSPDVAPTSVVDAVVPPLPSIAFTFGPRPASDPQVPVPTSTQAGGSAPLAEMDWLS